MDGWVDGWVDGLVGSVRLVRLGWLGCLLAWLALWSFGPLILSFFRSLPLWFWFFDSVFLRFFDSAIIDCLISD